MIFIIIERDQIIRGKKKKRIKELDDDARISFCGWDRAARQR
jgi:hypothetical protein